MRLSNSPPKLEYHVILLITISSNFNFCKSHRFWNKSLLYVLQTSFCRILPDFWLCLQCLLFIHLIFKKDFIYFIFGGEGRRRGRETSMCGCLLHAPYWGPGPQLRQVPWLGIELVTLWFAGQYSIHWASPATTTHLILK